MNKWIKPMGFLLIMILMCSVVARVAGRSETLAEYALKHPQTFASPDASSNPARTEVLRMPLLTHPGQRSLRMSHRLLQKLAPPPPP